MVQVVAQLVVSGLMLGSIYGLMALGLALIWGIMEVVNFAHGEFLMVALFASYWLFTEFGLDPILSVPIVAGLLFLLGLAVYKFVVGRVSGGPAFAPMLSTYGVSIVLISIAGFTMDWSWKRITETMVSGRTTLAGVAIGYPEFTAAVVSIVMAGAVYWFVTRTRMGGAIQATSMDKDAAQLMGIDTHRVYLISFGIGAACVGVAGGVMATYYPIAPNVGALFSYIAFTAVALGGFGSILGAVIGGLVIGVTMNLGAYFIGTEFKHAIVFVMYLLVLLFKPEGLFGR
jgi:branched-chain amino acid transport system permease protein